MDATDEGEGDGGASATDVADASLAPCSRSPRRAAMGADYALSARVEVLRDDMGVPHVYGANDADTVFGAGYMQAVDRAFQMEVLRRTAYGTTAELFGPSSLAQDRIVRMVDLGRWGRASAERIEREAPATFQLVRAWVGGVNKRLAELRAGAAPRPPGLRAGEYDFVPEPWTVDDAMTVGRLLLFRNANQLEFDVLATIIAKYVDTEGVIPLFMPITDAYVLAPDERPRARPMSLQRSPSAGRDRARPSPARPQWSSALGMNADSLRERFREWSRSMDVFRSGGSNNWAVAGRFTENGRPIIAGDPHQRLTSPAVFWLHHMSSATSGPMGPLDVVGFGFAGTPGVQLGHNRRVVWTATTTYPDFMDIVEVRQNRANGTVSLAGAEVSVERCLERIAVRGGPTDEYVVEDVPGQGVLLPANFAPLPLTSNASNRALFRWVGFRATVEADVFLGFDRAQNVGQFEAHVDRMETGAFNWVSADAQDISYRVHVLLPDRGNPAELPYTPNRLLPANNARVLWPMDRFASVDYFPRSRGASRGFLSSANNDPFGFVANGRTDDDLWYYGVWFDPGTRARRIDDELTRLTQRAAGGGAKVTTSEMEALQLDTHSILADELLPVLEATIARVDTDGTLAEFRGDAALRSLADALRSWDRNMDRDSSGAVIYEGFQQFLLHRALADELGPVFDAINGSEPIYLLKFMINAVKGRHPMADTVLQGGRDRLVMLALRDTKEWLIARFGGVEPSRYRWRDLHRTQFRTLFDPPGVFDTPELQTNGSIGTVNVSQGPFLAAGGARAARMFHTSSAGAVYRMVADFESDGTPRARINFARGNSGDPSSPHWGDQVESWDRGVYRPLAFRRADVDARTSERLAIDP
ncbi:MAG: penicillin acylase family protein [Polyangiales bacterium]